MHTGLQLLRPSLPAHCGPSCSESALADWQRQLPNALTLARVFALPPFVAAFCSPAATHRAVPAALFAILSVTDLADGYLARKWEVQTEFGAFLDPVADKLLVCTTLILLSATFGLCVALPAIIIVCREIAVSGLRECARIC
jgi:CDP-diacylglycerol--glycerol-3-phosphate 3-phosphatidyltransferase